MPTRGYVVLAAGTGLRQGECFGLTVDRLDMLRRTLAVGSAGPMILVQTGHTMTSLIASTYWSKRGCSGTETHVETVILVIVTLIIISLAWHSAERHTGHRREPRNRDN